jgi:hypothetical protein
MKMGVTQAETQFQAINMKIETLDVLLNKLKMEAEGN